MFDPGDVVDNAFVVVGPCSDAGGMGTIVFVERRGAQGQGRMVLKFCKVVGEELRSRFRREVRVMQQFNGNSHVMPVLHANLEHDPPYFVMPFMEHGDLAGHAESLRAKPAHVEWACNRMIDCVEQLHAQDVRHRDIKPQNFLVTDTSLVVSDLGLCTDQNATAVLTRSSGYGWGTPSYQPPEFSEPGGFKEAGASADIFMLGKAFYFLLSGRDPLYIVPDAIPAPLRGVIDRCCAGDKRSRYQSLASLRQSLTAAFDVLLGRVSGPGPAYSTLRSILDRLRSTRQVDPTEVGRFIEQLAVLEDADKIKLCLELPHELFEVLALGPPQPGMRQFIGSYKLMAEQAEYAWSFAETIAIHMRLLFEGLGVSPQDKADALSVAIIAAERQNRFAAMDTCTAMITNVTEPELAARVREVLLQHAYYFLTNIDESVCRAAAVKTAVAELRNQGAHNRNTLAPDDLPFWQ